jgi:antitoxin StbD
MPVTVDGAVVASVSDLKQDPVATVESGKGTPVAILHRSKPVFYCVPAELYEAILERLDDQDLAAIVRERKTEPSVRIDLGEL